MTNFILLYIDPGSGSYLIQAIVAGILGIAFFFKNILLWVKSLFIRTSDKTNDNAEADV